MRREIVADGKLVKKYFQQRVEGSKTISGDGCMKGVTALPYRLPELLKSKGTVLIVEGEKCADAAAARGLTATTNHGGGGKWPASLNEHFRNRDVVILPDNDATGLKHGHAVALALTDIAKSIRILELPDLPPKGDIVDWLDTGGTVETLKALAKAAPAFDPEKPLELPPATGEEASVAGDLFDLVLAADVKPVDVQWLVHEMMPAKGMCVLYGPPGTYKSFVALYLSMKIATGQEAFGHRTAQGNSVYVMAEGGSGLPQRIAAYKARHGMPDDTPLRFLRSSLDLRGSAADADKLIRSIHALDFAPNIITIDTLGRAFGGGDENSSKDFGAFMAQVQRIIEEFDCVVLLLHHSGKDIDRGMRGHSSLLGWIDGEYEVSKLSNDESPDRIGQLVVKKVRDGEDGAKYQYRLDRIELSKIDSSKTSLVVVPIDQDDKRITTRRIKPVTGNGRSLLNALSKAIEEVGAPVASGHIPTGARCVTRDQWRSYFYQMSPQDDETKRKTFMRTAQQLSDTGHVCTWGEWSWKTQ